MSFKNNLPFNELKEFLDEKSDYYNNPRFIETDPIQIPHKFSKKEDIEIMAFIIATIAWGNRTSIIKNGHRLIEIMGNNPYDFILNYTESNTEIDNFKHRTFNGIDLDFFFKSLQNIYTNHKGLENCFAQKPNLNLQHRISEFKTIFFEINHPARTQKHVSNPQKGSAAKRINMFLRWMVRKDTKGVDFGLWSKINPSELSCPLDVHSGNIARKINILSRTQNDQKALSELDTNLRAFNSADPVKYDFALFGLGAMEDF